MGISRNQKKALAALLTCSTVEQAAAQAGLCEATIYTYLRDDAFKAELRALQDRTINAATAALSGLAGDAIGVLRDALGDQEATTATRVRAALGVLDQLRGLVTFADFEDRIAALERQGSR